MHKINVRGKRPFAVAALMLCRRFDGATMTGAILLSSGTIGLKVFTNTCTSTPVCGTSTHDGQLVCWWRSRTNDESVRKPHLRRRTGQLFK